MNEKPEALEIADDLEAFARFSGGGGMDVRAAAELRRLHAENETLTATRDRQASMLRRLEDREAELDAEIGRLRRENERLREEVRVLSLILDGFVGPVPTSDEWRMMCNKANELKAALRREDV